MGHTDVTQIAERDPNFSSLCGRVGHWHAKLAIRFVNFGYRVWANSGAKFFPVSTHARECLRSAGVPSSSIVPQTWGPMVDQDLFCLEKPKDEVDAVRERLTFGIPNAFLMVYIGRVTAEKDIQFLIDALEQGPKNVVLALIGPGSMTSTLREKHGKINRLYCTGEFVPREDVAILLRAANCCVSASTMETVGFTAMESLSCGTPMLAVNAQGFAEHLSHETNARLWKPHDMESFQSELRQLMSTPREGNWSAERLRKSIATASIDDCTNRCLQAYVSAGPVNLRILRTIFAYMLFIVNLLLSCFMT